MKLVEGVIDVLNGKDV